MEKIYQTLQEFFSSIGLPLSQNLEMTVHPMQGLHGDQPMKSPLFRTNYYTFLLIEKGKGSYTIDNQTFNIIPYTFYFTNPGHLKSFQIEDLMEGYMVTFSEKFVKQYFAGDFYQLFPFLIYETTPVMYLNQLIFNDLATLAQQMLQEYNGTSPYKSAILTNLLTILLFKTKELLITHRAHLKPASRATELVQEFKNLLNKNFQQLAIGEINKVLTIKELAEDLNVHPNYLSNVIKEETGKSASDWIQTRILAEAQARLQNTSQNISEIAFGLGFNDTAHFAKFFKKHTQQSPSDYRKNQNI
ncbi:MAG: AraC family transcriptional regulator [Microscillaceae bacterium]|jgi:AraC-like DNA-binding protein|nr:AraC family transcriptional regulator [Microscillaceae bacterium]